MKNAKVVIEPEIGQQDEKITLKFEGDLTLRNIEALKKEVDPLPGLVTNVDVSVQEVEAMDVSFIQLLLSLSKSVKEEGKEISISLSLSEELKDLMLNTGFCTGSFKCNN